MGFRSSLPRAYGLWETYLTRTQQPILSFSTVQDRPLQQNFFRHDWFRSEFAVFHVLVPVISEIRKESEMRRLSDLCQASGKVEHEKEVNKVMMRTEGNKTTEVKPEADTEQARPALACHAYIRLNPIIDLLFFSFFPPPLFFCHHGLDFDIFSSLLLPCMFLCHLTDF